MIRRWPSTSNTNNNNPPSGKPRYFTGEELEHTYPPPDYEAENKALTTLAQTMGASPHMILQRLAETALCLCRADTAGISLLENHNGEEAEPVNEMRHTRLKD